MAGSPSALAAFGQRVTVGVGDAATSNNPNVTLSTYALGSCVGVVAYDPVVRVGGVLHLMLPHSSIAPAKAVTQPSMFADTGLPRFFNDLVGLRVGLDRLRIFIAGGASVIAGADSFKVGERNLDATRLYLTQNRLTPWKSQVGGTINRTLHLVVSTGLLTIKTPGAIEALSLAD